MHPAWWEVFFGGQGGGWAGGVTMGRMKMFYLMTHSTHLRLYGVGKCMGGKGKRRIFLFNNAPNTFIGIRIPLWIITFESTQTTLNLLRFALWIITFESTQTTLNLLRSPLWSITFEFHSDTPNRFMHFI